MCRYIYIYTGGHHVSEIYGVCISLDFDLLYFDLLYIFDLLYSHIHVYVWIFIYHIHTCTHKKDIRKNHILCVSCMNVYIYIHSGGNQEEYLYIYIHMYIRK